MDNETNSILRLIVSWIHSQEHHNGLVIENCYAPFCIMVVDLLDHEETNDH